ncbi:hypothetical protein AVEN_234855-1 [Araneus ventricosus]|uniref:Secreted protein n=1 Tax=Araneus ventricosus TaxID=182803 RepID=A0A4Y2II28_ARAVE|nr:hypothetical protein AVEN_234855-1 [Araneus ventricosus]
MFLRLKNFILCSVFIIASEASNVCVGLQRSPPGGWLALARREKSPLVDIYLRKLPSVFVYRPSNPMGSADQKHREKFEEVRKSEFSHKSDFHVLYGEKKE